jgi:hypothetical protein
MDRFIIVEGDDQNVTPSFCFLEIPDVPHMDEVETPISQDDTFPILFFPVDDLF